MGEGSNKRSNFLLERIFTVFEKKHEAAGLHLWYKVKVVNHLTLNHRARAHATVDSIERLINQTEARSLYHSVEVSAD